MAIASDDIADSTLFLYCRVSRWRTSASSSASLNFIAGIRDPGLIASGFLIHSRKFCELVSAAPYAILRLLINWVWTGPIQLQLSLPPHAHHFQNTSQLNTRCHTVLH